MKTYMMLYRPDAAGNEVEIEVEVHPGRWVPYWPGNHWNPPEGGYAEDYTLIEPDTKGEWPYDNLTSDEDDQAMFLANEIAEQDYNNRVAAAYDAMYDQDDG